MATVWARRARVARTNAERVDRTVNLGSFGLVGLLPGANVAAKRTAAWGILAITNTCRAAVAATKTRLARITVDARVGCFRYCSLARSAQLAGGLANN